MNTRRLILIIALTLSGIVNAIAQEYKDSTIIQEQKTKPKREILRWGLSLEGSIQSSDRSSFGWGLQCSYRFNTNFHAGLGVRVFYWDRYYHTWHDDNYVYQFEKATDDDGKSNWRRQIDLALSATYILPVIKRGGIAFGGTAIFSPIPIETFEISRTPRSIADNNPLAIHDQRSGITETKVKHVYDAFQPGLFAEAGIYYDLNQMGEKCRLTLMYGIGTFDSFMGSRHSKVFDQKLNDHLPSKELCHTITLRMSVF